MWTGLVAIFTLLCKIFDAVTLILTRIFKKADEKQAKKDTAQANMDKAVKDKNAKDYLKSRADKHGAGR